MTDIATNDKGENAVVWKQIKIKGVDRVLRDRLYDRVIASPFFVQYDLYLGNQGVNGKHIIAIECEGRMRKVILSEYLPDDMLEVFRTVHARLIEPHVDTIGHAQAVDPQTILRYIDLLP